MAKVYFVDVSTLNPKDKEDLINKLKNFSFMVSEIVEPVNLVNVTIGLIFWDSNEDFIALRDTIGIPRSCKITISPQ